MSSADKWREFARAIEQCADQLEALSSNLGEEVMLEDLPAKWQLFERHEFVIGNQASGYMPSPILMEIASNLTLQSTRRRVAPDIDDWLSQLEAEVSHLHGALADGNNKQYRRRLQNIHNHVWAMVYGLQEEMQTIEYYIRTEFGHVESLKEKQVENKFCIERAKRYAEKLAHLDAKKFRALAHNNSDLGKIFFVKMSPIIQKCRNDLIAAIPQLEHILWTYRRHDKVTKSIWALSNHFARGEQVLRGDILDEELFASDFNTLKPESMAAHVDIVGDLASKELLSITKAMSPRKTNVEIAEEEGPVEVDYSAPMSVEAQKNAFEPHLAPFIELILKGRQSAKDYWLKQGDALIPVGVWLLWMHAKLRTNNKLTIELVATEPKGFEGNVVIEDFVTSLRNEH